MKFVKRSLVGAVVVLTLALSASALAQSPSQSAYGGPCASQQTACEPSSTLPFTGVDTTLMAGVGLALIGAGLVARRALGTTRLRTDQD
jgi:hypothetical protein